MTTLTDFMLTPEDFVDLLSSTAEISLPLDQRVHKCRYNLNVPGVYMIRNIASNHIYVGQTQNLRLRKVKHLLALKENRHENIRLQRAWNKYGQSSFMFIVVQRCDVKFLDYKEQRLLDTIREYSCYNIMLEARTPRGVIRRLETRLRMSEGQKRHCQNPEVRLARSRRATEQHRTTDPKVLKKRMLHVGQLSHTPELEERRSQTRRESKRRKLLEGVPASETDKIQSQISRSEEYSARARAKKKLAAGKPLSKFEEKAYYNPEFSKSRSQS